MHCNAGMVQKTLAFYPWPGLKEIGLTPEGCLFECHCRSHKVMHLGRSLPKPLEIWHYTLWSRSTYHELYAKAPGLGQRLLGQLNKKQEVCKRGRRLQSSRSSGDVHGINKTKYQKMAKGSFLYTELFMTIPMSWKRVMTALHWCICKLLLGSSARCCIHEIRKGFTPFLPSIESMH